MAAQYARTSGSCPCARIVPSTLLRAFTCFGERHTLVLVFLTLEERREETTRARPSSDWFSSRERERERERGLNAAKFASASSGLPAAAAAAAAADAVCLLNSSSCLPW